MAISSIHGHLPALQQSTRERPSEGGNRFLTIAPYYILAHSLFNQVQKKSCSQSKEPVKVVRSQRFNRYCMRLQKPLQGGNWNLFRLLNTCQVLAWRSPSNEPVYSRRQRFFIDHTVPFLIGQLVLLAPCTREYVMNVDCIIEVRIDVNGRSADDVLGTMLHKQGAETFISCSMTPMQRQHSNRCENCIPDGTRFITTLDPRNDVLDIHGKTILAGTAINIAENTTPVPTQQLLFDRNIHQSPFGPRRPAKSQTASRPSSLARILRSSAALP